VRLDHLLSKEHLAATDSSGNRGPGARIGRVCRWGAHMAETLVRVELATAVDPRTASSVGLRVGGWGVDRVGGAAGSVFQTSCWVLREQARATVSPGFGSSGPVWPSVAKLLHGMVARGLLPVGWWVCRGCCGVCGGWVGVRGWPLFENCTVDASIFVVKLPRANGECLGTRSR
jgi:hypothetical protein